jgi:hypothetical protein
MAALFLFSSSSTTFTAYRRRQPEKPENLKNAMLFRKSGSISCKSTYTLRDSKRWERMEINEYPTRCRISLNMFVPYYSNNLISNPEALQFKYTRFIACRFNSQSCRKFMVSIKYVSNLLNITRKVTNTFKKFWWDQEKNCSIMSLLFSLQAAVITFINRYGNEQVLEWMI